MSNGTPGLGHLAGELVGIDDAKEEAAEAHGVEKDMKEPAQHC